MLELLCLHLFVYYTVSIVIFTLSFTLDGVTLFSSKLIHAMVISALSFTLDGVTLFSSKLMHAMLISTLSFTLDGII